MLAIGLPNKPAGQTLAPNASEADSTPQVACGPSPELIRSPASHYPSVIAFLSNSARQKRSFEFRSVRTWSMARGNIRTDRCTPAGMQQLVSPASSILGMSIKSAVYDRKSLAHFTPVKDLLSRADREQVPIMALEFVRNAHEVGDLFMR